MSPGSTRTHGDQVVPFPSSSPQWDPIGDLRRYEHVRGRLFDIDPVTCTVGRYELRERLGRGSSGFVHRGFDPVLEREVAVKLIPLPPRASDARVEELMAEARTLGALDHPNLVTIHDAGVYRMVDMAPSSPLPEP